MKLLIFTQKVDKNDSTLGFFCTWIREIAKTSESVSVICLEKGQENEQLDLPKNVTVYSLGKDPVVESTHYRARKWFNKLFYLKNFYHYLLLISGSYDKVFVHMNQEYILFAGLYWKLKNIPIYFWRNHPRGNLFTYIAVLLSTKVFCTSKNSFTARFKKTIIMPAGIDITLYRPINGVVRKKYSVCMVGRISPIKHVELALEAVNEIISSGVQISLNIIGNPTEKDLTYYSSLKKYVEKNNLSTCVSFTEAVLPDKLPEIYNSHEVCLNLTEDGSFDKTIVEASACGAIPLVSNISLTGMLPDVCITQSFVSGVARSLKVLLDAHQKVEIQDQLKSFVESQSLSFLVEKLFAELA